jgi:hypothetical protein
MNFKDFIKHYTDEESCIGLFKEYRLKQGITCKKCGSTEHYWNKAHTAFDCKHCRYRTTLRSGTVMESSKLPFQYWAYAIFLMTMTKKGISAKELQRQLDHKRYEPIWAMMHKLRAIMGIRDSKYTLEGLIELDDAFFASHGGDKDDKENKGKRGRGTTKSKVLVMSRVEPKKGRPKKHKKNSSFRYVKMLVIPDSSAGTINAEVGAHVGGQATAKTDKWRGFNNLKDIIHRHRPIIVPPNEAPKKLPWVHTMISNAKRNILGINHNNIKDGYLQNYLNEFCYKTNRRYFGDKLFDRLMIASVCDTSYGKYRYEYG